MSEMVTLKNCVESKVVGRVYRVTGITECRARSLCGRVLMATSARQSKIKSAWTLLILCAPAVYARRISSSQRLYHEMLHERFLTAWVEEEVTALSCKSFGKRRDCSRTKAATSEVTMSAQHRPPYGLIVMLFVEGAFIVKGSSRIKDSSSLPSLGTMPSRQSCELRELQARCSRNCCKYILQAVHEREDEKIDIHICEESVAIQ
jgi:hypothetical protein